MTKLELANEQIRKVIGYLKQNEKYMDYMDLKLHDVSLSACNLFHSVIY